MAKPSKSWYTIQAKSKGVADVYIYDEIGIFGVSAQSFVDELKAVEAETINLHIHSPGGSVFDGWVIYNHLSSFKGTINTTIDGIAASMASVIALSGSTVRMVENGFFMIHNPLTVAIGDAEEMRKNADLLDKIKNGLVRAYANKTGLGEDEISGLMDEETWFTAEEAKADGFIDTILEPKEIAAKFTGDVVNKFTNTPQEFAQAPKPRASTSKTKNKEPVMAEEYKEKFLNVQSELNETKQTLADVREELKNEKTARLDEAKKYSDGLNQRATKAAEIIKLGKNHGKIDAAIEAIENQKSVEDFKDDILNLYANGNENHAPNKPDAPVNVDPEKEPKDFDEMIQVHAELAKKDARKASTYLAKWSAKKQPQSN